MDSHQSLKSGAVVSIVCERDGAQVSYDAKVIRDLGGTIEVAIEGFSEHLGRPLAVVVGDSTTGEFVSVQESTASRHALSLETWGPWQRRSDRRTSARFATSYPCELRSRERVDPGRCLDVSLDGVSVETAAWDEPEFTLAMQIGETGVELPCVAVRVAGSGGMTVVHALFDDLGLEAGLALVGLVEASRQQSNAA